MSTYAITLPYPPTANNLYANYRGRRLLSKKGRAYHRDVAILVIAENTTRYHKRPKPLTGSLEVHMFVTCPDRRRRDLDNVQKVVWDALGKAGVYGDDSQIDRLHVYRSGPPKKPGRVDVEISNCGPSAEGGDAQ